MSQRRRREERSEKGILERSVVVPLGLKDTWELFHGNRMQNLVEVSDSVVEVRNYRLRDNGTPEYVMVNQAGRRLVSHRSDYTVYQPPTYAVDRVLDSPLCGTFHSYYETVDAGTRVTHRWEVEPKGFMRILFPILRSRMAGDFQADLELIAERLRRRAGLTKEPGGGGPAL